MKFIQYLILIFLSSYCSSPPIMEVAQLNPDGDSILIKGSLKNIPRILKKEKYTFELRYYRCNSLDFGKKKADSGQYPRIKNDCRNVFHSEKITSSKPEFSIQTKSIKDWTHGFIQLQDIEEIVGMYSPGENPKWFFPEDIKNGEVKINFDFVSMENPIPDSEQIKFANKFSPIIVLKKDKKYIPTNLAKYSKIYKIEKNESKKKDSSVYDLKDAIGDDYLILDESLYGKGETHIYYHVRYANTFVSGTNPKALPGWRDNRNYRYEKGDGDIVISYYLWYDYNDGPSSFGNRHEGDFESFAILADKSGKPKRLMLTGHDHIMLDTSWDNINSFDNHPIIYIAHGRGSADGGNPTSAYGGYETTLEAGNAIFNWMANPKDIFPEIGKDAKLIIPGNIEAKDLTNLRIGPGEWISKENTKYIDASSLVDRKIERLVKWEEPGWVNKKADKDPDKNHSVIEEDSYYMNFRGRLGRHPNSSLSVLKLVQYGKSPVNVPFKMNIEQHFTLQNPKEDRCEKVRIGDYCEKFKGDSKTPQFK